MDFKNDHSGPVEEEPFPQLSIAPDQEVCAGPLLESMG